MDASDGAVARNGGAGLSIGAFALGRAKRARVVQEAAPTDHSLGISLIAELGEGAAEPAAARKLVIPLPPAGDVGSAAAGASDAGSAVPRRLARGSSSISKEEYERLFSSKQQRLGGGGAGAAGLPLLLRASAAGGRGRGETSSAAGGDDGLDLSAYEVVPVEDFGAAVLRGMGVADGDLGGGSSGGAGSGGPARGGAAAAAAAMDGAAFAAARRAQNRQGLGAAANPLLAQLPPKAGAAGGSAAAGGGSARPKPASKYPLLVPGTLVLLPLSALPAEAQDQALVTQPPAALSWGASMGSSRGGAGTASAAAPAPPPPGAALLLVGVVTQADGVPGLERMRVKLLRRPDAPQPAATAPLAGTETGGAAGAAASAVAAAAAGGGASVPSGAATAADATVPAAAPTVAPTAPSPAAAAAAGPASLLLTAIVHKKLATALPPGAELAPAARGGGDAGEADGGRDGSSLATLPAHLRRDALRLLQEHRREEEAEKAAAKARMEAEARALKGAAAAAPAEGRGKEGVAGAAGADKPPTDAGSAPASAAAGAVAAPAHDASSAAAARPSGAASRWVPKSGPEALASGSGMESAPAAAACARKRPKPAPAPAPAPAAAAAPVAAPPAAHWLHPGITVRVADERWSRALFKAKAVVADVTAPGVCDIRLPDGRLVQSVPERVLETALPKPGGRVLLLAGRRRGEAAVLMARDAGEQIATVRSLNDGAVLRMSYDHVAEVVGAVE